MRWVVWVAYGTRPIKCLIFSVIFVVLSSSSTGLQLRGATEAPALRAGVAAVIGESTFRVFIGRPRSAAGSVLSCFVSLL
jgi:hypothetical protein